MIFARLLQYSAGWTHTSSGFSSLRSNLRQQQQQQQKRSILAKIITFFLHMTSRKAYCKQLNPHSFIKKSNKQTQKKEKRKQKRHVFWCWTSRGRFRETTSRFTGELAAELRVDFVLFLYFFVSLCCWPSSHLASVFLCGFFASEAELGKASSIVTEVM